MSPKAVGRLVFSEGGIEEGDTEGRRDTEGVDALDGLTTVFRANQD